MCGLVSIHTSHALSLLIFNSADAGQHISITDNFFELPMQHIYSFFFCDGHNKKERNWIGKTEAAYTTRLARGLLYLCYTTHAPGAGAAYRWCWSLSMRELEEHYRRLERRGWGRLSWLGQHTITVEMRGQHQQCHKDPSLNSSPHCWFIYLWTAHAKREEKHKTHQYPPQPKCLISQIPSSSAILQISIACCWWKKE